MKMLRIDKVLSLKSGSITGNKLAGNASGLGNMDSYRDVIFPSGFADEVVSDFLSTGFNADCHDWSKVIGMPLAAEVKGNVVYSEFEFHSTQDAQDLKTKCAERLDRGLAVGLSVGIGFWPESTKNFPNGAALLAYAEQIGEDMSLFDVEGIKAWTGKCRAIIRVDKWYEYSPILTATPANPNAWATGLKNGAPLSSMKGEFLGNYVEAAATMSAVQRITDALYWNVFYDAIYYDDIPLDERRATLVGGLTEYSTIVLRVWDAIMASEPEAEVAEEAMKAIKAYWSDPTISSEGELPAGAPFEKQLKSALAAVTSCTERARSLQELRAKEGRTISTARREQLTAQRDEMQATLSTLSSLLEEVPTESSPNTEAEQVSKNDGVGTPGSDESTDVTPAAVGTANLAQLQVKQLQRKNRDREIFPEGNA